jgi:hypothetical protein
MGLFDRLKSSLGSKGKETEKKHIDVTSIRYSMPTIAADQLKFLLPSAASFEGAPQFHEDEWCQIEFLPAASLTQVKSTLSEYKAFEQAHRLQHGWSEIFARRIARVPLIEGLDAVSRLAGQFGATAGNAPILTTASRPLGQVEGGFVVKPSSDVLLYGVASEQGIHSLGAMVHGNDMQLSQVFAKLYSSFGLMLIDWRGQLALCSVGPDGNFGAWRP